MQETVAGKDGIRVKPMHASSLCDKKGSKTGRSLTKLQIVRTNDTTGVMPPINNRLYHNQSVSLIKKEAYKFKLDLDAIHASKNTDHQTFDVSGNRLPLAHSQTS